MWPLTVLPLQHPQSGGVDLLHDAPLCHFRSFIVICFQTKIFKTYVKRGKRTGTLSWDAPLTHYRTCYRGQYKLEQRFISFCFWCVYVWGGAYLFVLKLVQIYVEMRSL